MKDIPLSVSNDLIAEHMSEIGVNLKTDGKYERDNNGKLTDYKNGDRYMYAEGPIKNALNRNTYIAHRKCRIFHNGQFNVDCKACHQAGVAGQQFPRPVLPLGSVRMRVTLGYGNVYFLSYTGLVVPLMYPRPTNYLITTSLYSL